ncbi:MAG: LacI family DNA-binding transcriptional regulator [Sumerlaeia bacterium]
MASTIHDIARMAGVSIGTVSRVINGKDRVAPDTRARVLSLIEQYNFRPRASARGLAMNKTRSIMLLVSDIGNIYFAELAKEISRHCRVRGYKVLLGDSDETISVESEHLKAMTDGSVDGLIIAPLSTDANIAHYGDLIERGFPLVMLDTNLPGVKASCVRVDNRLGGEMAVDYLVEKGHRRIAFVSGDTTFQTNRLRYEGYCQGLQKHGLPLREPYLVPNQEFLEEQGFCGVERLMALAEPPTAIFATSDLTAMGCIRAATAQGCRVPEDVAVLGFDNLKISAHLGIPLTTVGQPREEIGRQAVDLLLAKIDADKSKKLPIEERLVPPQIVVRASA